MADTIDQIQEWNELHTKVSLHNQQLKSLPETHPDFDGEHCVDCAEDVEAPRLALQRIRCFACQDMKERLDALRQRNGRPE